MSSAKQLAQKFESLAKANEVGLYKLNAVDP
jgi:hypothetical protein